jgi:hypothetical protein
MLATTAPNVKTARQPMCHARDACRATKQAVACIAPASGGAGFGQIAWRVPTNCRRYAVIVFSHSP